MNITERIEHYVNSHEFWRKDTRDELGIGKSSPHAGRESKWV